MVNKECYETWKWFLSTIETDLRLQNHKQKGLIKALNENFKESAKRFCVKHLHCNMKTAGFTGNAVKESLWKMATSTTITQFEGHMVNLEKIKERDPDGWCRAYFGCFPQCDMFLRDLQCMHTSC